MKKIILCLMTTIFLSSPTLAKDIRTIHVNDQKMQLVQLKLGQATVLRFNEKPKKVVIGNQNYYSVEFIDNDLTIQPLGLVKTNLFVYTKYRTYGFDLSVCNHCQSDDLLNVKWKSKLEKPTKPSVPKIPGFSVIGVSKKLNKYIEIEVIKTKIDQSGQVRIFDLNIKNLGGKELSINTLKIEATQNDLKMKRQGYVLEKDLLKPKQSAIGRLFLSSDERQAFTIQIFDNKSTVKIKIDRKYLK